MTTVNTLPSVRFTIPSVLAKEDHDISEMNDVSINNIWQSMGQETKNQQQIESKEYIN